MMSSELDVLLVGYNDERFAPDIRQAFRHWQVYTCASPHALYGRRFRRVFVTGAAYLHHRWPDIYKHLTAIGADVRDFLDFIPEYEVPTVDESELLTSIRRARHPVS